MYRLKAECRIVFVPTKYQNEYFENLKWPNKVSRLFKLHIMESYRSIGYVINFSCCLLPNTTKHPAYETRDQHRSEAELFDVVKDKLWKFLLKCLHCGKGAQRKWCFNETFPAVKTDKVFSSSANINQFAAEFVLCRPSTERELSKTEKNI